MTTFKMAQTQKRSLILRPHANKLITAVNVYDVLVQR